MVAAPGRGRVASDYDFDALDINNNNRIERREWQARLEQFDRLDVNGDNFLSRAEVEAVQRRTSASAQRPRAVRRIAVAADRAWTDTGINVRVGEQLTINADGRIRLAQDSRNFVTAAGANDGSQTRPCRTHRSAAWLPDSATVRRCSSARAGRFAPRGAAVCIWA